VDFCVDFSSDKAILTIISAIFEEKLTQYDGKSSEKTLRFSFARDLVSYRKEFALSRASYGTVKTRPPTFPRKSAGLIIRCGCLSLFFRRLFFAPSDGERRLTANAVASVSAVAAAPFVQYIQKKKKKNTPIYYVLCR
jgi:hypothetical protein